MKKTKSNKTKSKRGMHPQQNILQHKMNTRKLKTKKRKSRIAFYDIWPGNRMGLFSKKAVK